MLHTIKDIMCVSCFALQKDLLYLLFSCPFTSTIWNIICDWLELNHFIEDSALKDAEKLFTLIRGKTVR